jgi:hypothetical protein
VGRVLEQVADEVRRDEPGAPGDEDTTHRWPRSSGIPGDGGCGRKPALPAERPTTPPPRACGEGGGSWGKHGFPHAVNPAPPVTRTRFATFTALGRRRTGVGAPRRAGFCPDTRRRARG